MKYMIKLLSATMMMLFFTTSAAFAMPSTKTVIMDDSFNLSTIHSIAVAMPDYIQTKNSPKIEDVMATLAQSGFDAKQLKNVTVIPYTVIANAIEKDSGVDLQTLDKNAAKKVFKQDIGKYADAYLVATIANDSRVVIFYDLYSAKNGAYLYSFEVIGGGQGDNNINAYKSFNGLFYNGFAESVKSQYKDKKAK